MSWAGCAGCYSACWLVPLGATLPGAEGKQADWLAEEQEWGEEAGPPMPSSVSRAPAGFVARTATENAPKGVSTGSNSVFLS